MKTRNSGHLQEERITWAVIDEKELADAERLHLAQCEMCRRKVERMLHKLAEIGEVAGLSVPPFTKDLILPQEKPVRSRHRTGWLSFAGAAAMAGVVLFFYFLGMEASPPYPTTQQSPESLLAEERLMQEISDMVENPLSEEIYEITGDAHTVFDDEFFEFLVPDGQEDFQSENNMQGGAIRC